MNTHIKVKDRDVGTSGRREGKWKVCRGGWILLMYFIYLYENRTMKLVEIVLRIREKDEEE
jgi:hypothetical protein